MGVGAAIVTATAAGRSAEAALDVLVPPAPVARLTVTINSYGDVQALMGLTPVRFDLGGSEDAALRYRVEFGDGATATEAVSTHVYDNRGRLTVRATVTDVLGRSATVASEVRVASLLNLAGYEW